MQKIQRSNKAWGGCVPLLATTLFIITLCQLSAKTELPVIHCMFTDKAPRFDGVYHVEDWKKAEMVSMVRNCHSGMGKASELQSRVQCMWDSSNFYVLFTFTDHAVSTVRHAEGASLWSDASLEVAEMILNPKCSDTDYFELNISPDGLMNNYHVLWKNGAASTWETNWFVKPIVRSTGLLSVARDGVDGWFAQIRISWDQLDTTAKTGDAWRINFYRAETDLKDATSKKASEKKCELLAWSPTLAHSFHIPKMFGTIELIRCDK